MSQVDLDKLMQTIREQIDEDAASNDGGSVDSARVDTVSSASPSGTTAADIPFEIDDIMELQDKDFINAAYIMLLGRAPDPSGLKNFTERLQARPGERLSILHEIKNSDEGQKYHASVPLPPLPQGLSFPKKPEWRAFARRMLGVPSIIDLGWKFDSLKTTVAPLSGLPKAVEGLRSRLVTSESESLALKRELGELRATIDQTATDINQTATDINQTAGELRAITDRTAAELKAAVSDFEAKFRNHWRHIADQTRRLNVLIAEARKRLPEPIGPEQLQTFLDEEASQLNAFYVTFEDRYRGSREDIMQRQCYYLEYVREAAESAGTNSFVDVGCGRGEFLEVLRTNGMAGRGLDLNPIMVAECEERGLEAHLGDALDYLGSIPTGSLAGVSAFHIIEHLPLEKMVQFFDEALRALAPGGILICETPNPANLFVAAERFYIDPTHRNPLPSEMVSFLIEARGFVNVKVLPLHPVSSERRGYDDPMLALLQEKIYGPQDYGVIGWRAR
jgi:SAM-dependent methyltransferase